MAFFVVPCVLGVLSQKAVSLGRESQSVCVRRSRSLGLFVRVLYELSTSLARFVSVCSFLVFS